MVMLMHCLSELVLAAMQKSFPKQGFSKEDVEVTLATQEKFGHYQCNSALSLAKKLQQNPRMIAEKILSHLEQEMFAKVEIQGAGFINFTLCPNFLSKNLDQALRAPRLGVPAFVENERYIVEFSSPNIAKEMHVGHLRSTIIGDSLARLFEFLGAKVIRLNHVGDWGTAFGMLIAYIQQNEPEILSGEKTATLSDLMRLYRASKKHFDEDENFKKTAREAVIRLQAGDPQTLKAWEMICHISRLAFAEVYAILDIKIEERGESFYNPELPRIVEDLEKKGLVTLSEGAKCVFHEGIKLPLMVQKSDGGYNYDTTDMAAIVHRISVEKAKRIIVLTDAGQTLHFELIAKTAEKAGYLDPSKVRFDHVPFGLVLGPDGKKFRTRSGESEKLIDLLTKAIEEAKRVLAMREHEMNEAEIESLAAILGIDAVKYADLSCNRRSDYVFSYERMLRFDGNTAAFILYSYVRSLSIQRNIPHEESQLLRTEKIVLEDPSEVALGLHLLRFSEVLFGMARDLMPHYLTDYIYVLAQKFNQFFRDCQVQNHEHQNRRLLLCKMVQRTLATGLDLLGLKTVERM